MQLYNLRNKQLASQYVATEFLKQIKHRPDAVLGLATGSTMTELYTQLSDLLDANTIDVSGVRTFNLDEYVGAKPTDLHSYHAYMHQRFSAKMNSGILKTFIFLTAAQLTYHKRLKIMKQRLKLSANLIFKY